MQARTELNLWRMLDEAHYRNAVYSGMLKECHIMLDEKKNENERLKAQLLGTLEDNRDYFRAMVAQACESEPFAEIKKQKQLDVIQKTAVNIDNGVCENQAILLTDVVPTTNQIAERQEAYKRFDSSDVTQRNIIALKHGIISELGQCFYSGCPNPARQNHHVTPDANDPLNCAPLCLNHHKLVHGKNPRARHELMRDVVVPLNEITLNEPLQADWVET